MPHLEVIRHAPPSRWARWAQSLRTSLSLKDPELARKLGWGGGASAAGVSVSEATALNYAAVWQAVTLIAGDIGSTPLLFYKKLPNGGKERYTAHPTYELLRTAPNPEMSAMTYRQVSQAHLLTWGNAYSEIERDGAGRPVALWPIAPWRVSPERDEARRLRYRVSLPSGGEVFFQPADMLHIPGLGFDGIVGYSPIRQARESLGLLAAAERFGATFFGNGTTFGGALRHPKVLSEKAEKSLRDSLSAKHQGPDKAHRMLILEEGMDFTRFGVDPNDAQFLETRIFQIHEVARWFNLPLHKLREMKDSSVRANIEQEALDYVTSTLRPWFTAWEQEINRKLVSPRERNIQYAEFLIEGLLRGDIKSRYDAYAIGRNWGWLSVNDIRDRENMNPVEGGDVYLSPSNMVPADRLDEIVDKQVAPAPAPVVAPPDGDDPDDDEDERDWLAVTQQIAAQALTIGELQARAATAETTAAELRQALEDGRESHTAALAEAESRHAVAVSEAAQTLAEMTAERDAVVVERDAAWRQIDTLTIRAEAHKDDAERVGGQLAEVSAAHAAAVAELETIRQALAERNGEVVTATTAAAAAVDAQAVAEAARAEAEAAAVTATESARRASAEAASAVLAAQEADQRARAAEAETREAKDASVALLTRLSTASRGVVVEAVGRLVRRETEKARNKRATPEKLRAWAESFYEPHEADLWAQALRPVVALHQALTGDARSSDDVTAALVAAHFEASRRQVLAVAASDPEDYDAALTTTLRRWEDTRAAEMADQFTREEIAHVRTV